MSSDDHPLVLSPDMLQNHVVLADVEALTGWERDPYSGDVGAAHVMLGTFGQLSVPIVVDGEVLLGAELVDAERLEPQHGGQLAVLDLTDLDWPREKIIAAVLGLHHGERLASVDGATLLDLLQEVQKADEAWLAGAGYDGYDLEAIYQQLQRDQEALDAGGDQRFGLQPDETPAASTVEEQYGVIVECADEAEQQTVYERLTADGLRCRVVTV